MVVDEAYKAKAKKVTVEWSYQPLQKLHSRYQSVSTMGKVEDWVAARQEHYCQVLPCRIHLISEDPDGLKGVRTDKIAKARQMSYPILRPYIERRENREQWCIAAVPGVAWAKKLFPELSRNQAVEKLWEAILYTSRVDSDPVKAWEEHNARLKTRCDYLNSLPHCQPPLPGRQRHRPDRGHDARGTVLRRRRERASREFSSTPTFPRRSASSLPREGWRRHCLCHLAPVLPGPAD